MKKFIFIIDQSEKLIEVARKGSESYHFILNGFQIEGDGDPKKIIFSKNNLENLIDEKLQSRLKKPPVMPTYESRFTAEEMFTEIPFNGRILKLTQTEGDNFLIFLLNVFNSVQEQGETHFLLMGDSYSKLQEFNVSIS
jgi:hypothetical protein